MFKQFVLQYKDTAPNIYKFLSYIVSLPTSEADLDDTGTVDKLAFIRLNGPPPGCIKNRKLLKTALNLMYKSDYAPHVLYMGRNLKTTPVVVERILNASSNVRLT